MDKISIIIVHYNTDKDTRECLESLAKIEVDDFEYQILVVDNASREPLNLPKQYKNVQVITSDKNLGFTGGNNLGFSMASRDFNPDYFLLLNSDTLVKPDFLVKLHQKIKNEPQCGMMTPKIYFAPDCEFYHQDYKKKDRGKVIWMAGGMIDWDNLLTFHAGVDEVDRGQYADFEDFDFASGCCCLIRREALAVSGVFNDQYFLYYEDADLNMRLKKSGFTIMRDDEAIIWHKNGGSSQGSGSDLQNFYLSRNRLFFFFKYGKLRVKLRTLKLALNFYFKGNRVEKMAARNFLLRRFGKQIAI